MIDPLKLLLAFEQALLRDRDQQIAINKLVENRQIVNQRDLAHNLVRVKTRILCAIDDEAEKRLEVERVIRSGRHKHRIIVDALAVAGSVARSAVIGDAREADNFFGKTDGQLLSLLPRDAQRGVAAWPWQFFRKHARQHEENPIGNAG